MDNRKENDHIESVLRASRARLTREHEARREEIETMIARVVSEPTRAGASQGSWLPSFTGLSRVLGSPSWLGSPQVATLGLCSVVLVVAMWSVTMWQRQYPAVEQVAQVRIPAPVSEQALQGKESENVSPVVLADTETDESEYSWTEDDMQIDLGELVIPLLLTEEDIYSDELV